MAICSLPQLFLFSIILTITSVSGQGKCIEDQKALLLELKSEWKYNSSYSQKLVHWNQTDDCCSWGGVGCDGFGFVTHLHLQNESISGEIKNSSSLFSFISLMFLDLDSNSLGGMIPHSLFYLHSLRYLSLSNNLFNNISQPDSYELGSFTPAIVDNSLTTFLFLANNNLSGEVPTFFCFFLNVKYIEVLDLSFNNFRGNIPPCLLQNMYLRVLNMRGNKINGSIPDEFYSCTLSTLDLSNNDLDGKIPMSIASCDSLQVLNVGSNNFDDSFPCMLPSSLHVLVLRNNRFHGELRCDTSWPNLQIVDVSFNNFNGSLHPLNFSSWKGMILESDSHVRPSHSENSFLNTYEFYWDEVTLTVKGLERKLVKIWPDFTCIDFSSNNFQGQIPDAVGNLTSLYLLNLSHNALSGIIPKSLGALTELEALDLSFNQLRGRIPEELARLTFLSFLNLSYNELVGMIPNGRQFQTFSPDSFEGNKGLRGFPLNRSCSNHHGPGSTPSIPNDEEIEWEYVFAALGYVVGLGSIFWTLLCWRNFRERYFEKIEEVVEEIFEQRARRRREERRGRRVERRNELIRRQQQRS